MLSESLAAFTEQYEPSTSVRPAAIAAKPTNRRLRIGCALAQEIFIIRFPLINVAMPGCYEIRTEPIATNARHARSGHEFLS